MRRSLAMLSLTILLVPVVGCSAAPEGRIVTIEPAGATTRTKIDLGTAPPAAVLSHELRLRNPSGADVELVRFESSCECAAMLPARFSITAGGEVTCRLDVNLQQDPSFAGQLGIEIEGIDPNDIVVLKLLALLEVRPASSEAEHAGAN